MPRANQFQTVQFSTIALILLWQQVSAATSSSVDLVKEGYSLSQAEAESLETTIAKKPSDEASRLKLLGYYATRPAGVSLEAIRRRRATHIFWLIEKDPRCPLFEYVGATWKIFPKGDALADPTAFEEAKALWLRQVKSHPKDETIKKYASTFLEFGDTETAASLLRELRLNRAVGSLYAYRLLGVGSQDYKTGDPSSVDESFRDSESGKRILDELNASNDPMLVGGTGFWLAVQGGMLYADGKTNWDYSALSEQLLAKARRLDPNTLDWFAISTALPARGERPPRVLRMGNSPVRKASVQNSVTPVYPESAKAKRIEGNVVLNIVIGLDGKVVKSVAVSGPPELTHSAIDAVSQWEYPPTLLNGKPVFIITRVSVEFRLF